MERKTIIWIIVILLVGTAFAGLSITPTDETLTSTLPEETKTELKVYVRNVEYGNNISSLAKDITKDARAILRYEENITAWEMYECEGGGDCFREIDVWIPRSKSILLWLDSSECGNAKIEDCIGEKMLIGADKFMENKHSNLYPTIPTEVNVGTKTISLT